MSLFAILYILNLEKYFIKNQYYLYYKFYLSFLEAVVSIFQNTCKWLYLNFKQFYMSHSIIHFIKRSNKKGNYFFWMYSTGFQHLRAIAKRNNKIRKCNCSSYFPQKSLAWNHSYGPEKNEWIKLFNFFRRSYKLVTSK